MIPRVSTWTLIKEISIGLSLIILGATLPFGLAFLFIGDTFLVMCGVFLAMFSVVGGYQHIKDSYGSYTYSRRRDWSREVIEI